MRFRGMFILSVLLVSIPAYPAPRNHIQTQQVSVMANEKLAEWEPTAQDWEYDATVTFLSDDSIVLALCHPVSAPGCSLLIVLQIRDGRLSLVAQNKRSYGPVSLYRIETTGILAVSTRSRSSELLSSDLTLKQRIPYQPTHFSLSGKTMATYGPNDLWTIFRVCLGQDYLYEFKQVQGELEAVSDNEVAVREHDTIRVETMDGISVGGFKVRSKTKCWTGLQFVDSARIFMQSCGPDRIVDLRGKELVRFKSPRGTGFRQGWNSDGTKVLYDNSTRTVPFIQSVGEIILAVVTMGVGVADEQSNGEAIRVIDTTTGGTCFDWKDPKHPVDWGLYHAALSPSGKRMALVTRGELFVYRLPDVCAAK